MFSCYTPFLLATSGRFQYEPRDVPKTKAISMNQRFLIFPVVATLLAAQPSLSAAEAVKFPRSFDAKAIDAFLTTQAKQPDRVGFSVAIVKDGQVVLARGYGKRSLADGRPVEADTLFAIGS